MAGGFDRFSDQARAAMKNAKAAAEDLSHDYIGTEHILLGLLRIPSCLGAEILGTYSIDFDKAHAEVMKMTQPSGDLALMGELPLTAKAKRVMNYAINEAKEMQGDANQNPEMYIGTEHLLLGLLREEEGLAAQVLMNLGINVDAIKTQILDLMPSPKDPLYQPEPASKPKKGKRAKRRQKGKTPALDAFCRDLTAAARDGSLDPLIGRKTEVKRLLQIIVRRTKNNPVLIGEAGVGKTAIAEGLAQLVADGDVPELISNRRVVALDLALMVAGTKYRGQFEERMKTLMAEITREKNIILFVDELHTMVGAGAAEGSIDASNILKPALARGELQCIGATTLDEYRKYIEKDTALSRRFQPINVEEPTPENTIEILKGLRGRYEDHHKIEITDDAIKDAVRLSGRYITDRYLPDKAIDVIDEAGAMMRLGSRTVPPEVRELEKRVRQMERDKVQAVGDQNFELAAELRDRIENTGKKIEEITEEVDVGSGYLGAVTPDTIRAVISDMTGIPLRNMAATDMRRLLKIEGNLHERVVSQHEAVTAVAAAVRRSQAGLKDPKRPIASMLFLGPTGVGKSLLAKALSEYLFGTEDALVQIDMSEYSERHSISKLIGAPPGYVGYEEGGQLTEKIRRRPYSLILLDEIEKAHPDLFNALLQVMEDGRLSDGLGRTIDFRNTIMIMTSNVGAAAIKNQGSLGFGSKTEKASYESMKKKLKEEMEREFRPEFINRLDEVVIFKPLTKGEIKSIIELEVKMVSRRLDERGIAISLSDKAKEFILEKGFNAEYGARPLRRAIRKHIENPVSDKIILGEIPDGSSVTVTVDPDGDALHFGADEAAVPAGVQDG